MATAVKRKFAQSSRMDKVDYWLDVCRRFTFQPGEIVKCAELGGPPNEITFEQGFSNLAHSHLANKAPTLLDHELGFQLIDRNEEGNKALGVFVFKVGSQYIYAPIFFLRGAIKGHELLYLKDQDLFVPLKENWVNYILNRKPHILGSGTTRNHASLGVRQPDFSRLSAPPYKIASWVIPELHGFLPKYAELGDPDNFRKVAQEVTAIQTGPLSLDSMLKLASLDTLDRMVGMFRQYPVVAAAFDKWHGMEKLSNAISAATVRQRTKSIFAKAAAAAVPSSPSILTPSAGQVKAAKTKVRNKVQVIYYDLTVATPPDVSDDDKEKLTRDGVLVKDDREDSETSIAYDVALDKTLTNPTESGLYYVLMKPGTLEKCYVAYHPHTGNGRADFCTVVRLEDAKAWVNAHPSRVWTATQIDNDKYDQWVEGLPDATDLSRSGTFLLLTPRGDTTVPFDVQASLGQTAGSGKSYEVNFDDYCSLRATVGSTSQSSSPCCYDGGNSDGERVHLDAQAGTKLRVLSGDLYVPKGAKKLVLKNPPEESDSPFSLCSIVRGQSDTESPIRLGDIADAQLCLMSKTAELKLTVRDGEVRINNSRPRTKLAALGHLVKDHGLRETIAREMLKTAEQRFTTRYRIKYAEPYLTDQGPYGPAMPEPTGGANMMGFPGDSYESYQMEIPVDSMAPDPSNQAAYEPKFDGGPYGSSNAGPQGGGVDKDMATVLQAAEQGQKEVFDTAMFMTMARSHNPQDQLKSLLPELTRGMNAKGKALFMFYAHGDKVADNYGKQDMPELEDYLRNGFEQDGDLILFIKQKTVDPYPEESLRDLTLGTHSAE